MSKRGNKKKPQFRVGDAFVERRVPDVMHTITEIRAHWFGLRYRDENGNFHLEWNIERYRRGPLGID